MTDPDKPESAPAALVMRLRRATGMPVLDCKHFLEQFPPADRGRYVEMAEANRGRLHDPLEDDPTLGPIIRAVEREVALEVEKEHRKRIAELEMTSPALAEMLRCGCGLSHRVWHLMKQRLRERYGVEWRS